MTAEKLPVLADALGLTADIPALSVFGTSDGFGMCYRLVPDNACFIFTAWVRKGALTDKTAEKWFAEYAAENSIVKNWQSTSYSVSAVISNSGDDEELTAAVKKFTNDFTGYLKANYYSNTCSKCGSAISLTFEHGINGYAQLCRMCADKEPDVPSGMAAPVSVPQPAPQSPPAEVSAAAAISMAAAPAEPVGQFPTPDTVQQTIPSAPQFTATEPMQQAMPSAQQFTAPEPMQQAMPSTQPFTAPEPMQQAIPSAQPFTAPEPMQQTIPSAQPFTAPEPMQQAMPSAQPFTAPEPMQQQAGFDPMFTAQNNMAAQTAMFMAGMGAQAAINPTPPVQSGPQSVNAIGVTNNPNGAAIMTAADDMDSIDPATAPESTGFSTAQSLAQLPARDPAQPPENYMPAPIANDFRADPRYTGDAYNVDESAAGFDPGAFSDTPAGYTPVFKANAVPENSNPLLGLVGAVLFTLGACVIWILIGKLGFISYIGAFAMAFLCTTGYKKFGKKFDVFGIIVCAIVILLAVLACNMFIYTWEMFDEPTLVEVFDILGYHSFGEVFFNFFGCINTLDDLIVIAGENAEVVSTFVRDLALSYFFSLIGYCVVAIPQYQKRNEL